MYEDLIRVEHLSKIFTTGFIGRGKKIVAVDDVSFNCRSGEVIGLIGESGSGKTTTARLILKLLAPSGGEVYFRGKDIWTIPNREYYRHVQGVFQDPYSSINPVYKIKHIFNNTSNLLKEVPSDEISRRVKKVLEFVHLQPEEVLEKHIDELSGGELQRVLLANCLFIDPDVILADEPTSMIDASMRVIILNLIRELSEKQQKLVIFITHDISQAFYICNRILVMYQGKIVEQGSAEDVVLNPQHPYTKRLVADVPKLKQKFKLLIEESWGLERGRHQNYNYYQ